MLTPSNYVSVWFGEVYSDLAKDVGMSVKDYLSSLGYCNASYFCIPSLGDTYLTPDGKIATKEKGDKGPYGPRLILVEDLTESERTYGKGIKTGADALAKVKYASALAHKMTGIPLTGELDPAAWEVVEFRHLRDKETCCFIARVGSLSAFWIFGTQRGAQNHEAQGKPVYIVRPKQPRKKRVLVFDFDEVANATRVLAKEAGPGTYQWLRAVSLCGETVEIEGTVEERDA
jgi:hypothetical protein